jgi:uncharacterized protein GlcG (DUF336 family)
MTELSLDLARTILDRVLAEARANHLKPLAVAILDSRGALKAFSAEDGTSLKRGAIALGKAEGALALGIGSRAIAKMAAERPSFVAAVTHAVGGALVPAPGGVLIRRSDVVVGAVGVSGDTSDNDEACAIAAIQAAGWQPDPGA